jgi:endonuclease-3
LEVEDDSAARFAFRETITCVFRLMIKEVGGRVESQGQEQSSQRQSQKRPFEIPLAFKLIEKAIAPYPKAMLFELAELGFQTPYHQLIACVISIRTLDEVSRGCALELLKACPTPTALAALSEEEIDRLIHPATFHRQKAGTLRTIADEIVHRFAGELPCEQEALLSLKGVGPKCANLVLGVACGRPFIAVDVHVHRVTNRWGYVRAPTPEKTLRALEAKLDQRYWIDLNRLLVPFGKHICTGTRPKCSSCVVRDMCQQVGVRNPR